MIPGMYAHTHKPLQKACTNRRCCLTTQRKKKKKFSLVFHCTNLAGQLSSSSTEDIHAHHQILNSESGWHLAGGTKRFRRHRRNQRTPRPSLAFDTLCRPHTWEGYHVSLRGVVDDGLVFCGLAFGEKERRRFAAPSWNALEVPGVLFWTGGGANSRPHVTNH